MPKTKHDTFTMLEYERQYAAEGKKYIAGVDEVGRGPLAGPVVVACVIMPLGDEDIIQGVNDSKKVSEKNREILFEKIMQKAIACKIEWADEKVIDEINILQATKRCMQRAVDGISISPDIVLIDAVGIDCKYPTQSIIKGDAKSYSIACASIVAKVTRDRYMAKMDEVYPQYGFASNKGYGSAKHIEALKSVGACPIHRRSFIKNFVGQDNE
ncbi:MAG: ribonuclease HII [Clostridia bacterium]|nr:ribonuclease HII [Clostridia bacterium]